MTARSLRLLLSFVLLGAPTTASGQGAPPAIAQLDRSSRAVIERSVAAALDASLPVQPLWNKVMEGVSKGATGPQVANAVVRLHGRLARAASVLGPAAPVADLVAGAAVLDVGLGDDDLRDLRTARPAAPLASALVGIVFLVQRGVDAAAATGVVSDMLRANVTEADFDRFRGEVTRDVGAGASVTSAARARARTAIERVSGGTLSGAEPGPRGRL